MTKRVPKVPSGQREFASWLRKRREQAGVTQAKVAAHAGLSERQVMRWEETGNRTALSMLRYLEIVGVKLVPAPSLSEADELLLRLERAVRRIEAALTTRQASPDAPRSAGGRP